jgi:hypothetical protein
MSSVGEARRFEWESSSDEPVLGIERTVGPDEPVCDRLGRWCSLSSSWMYAVMIAIFVSHLAE